MDVSFFAGVKYNDKIFFSAMYLNAFMCFDCITHKVRYIKSFEKEKIKMMLHRHAYRHKEAIWFIPWNGTYVARVDVGSFEIEYFEIPYFEKDAFVDAVAYEDRYLFLIPNGDNMRSLVKVDMERSKIECCGDALPDGFHLCAGGYVWEDELRLISASGEICSTYHLSSGIIDKKSGGGLQGYHSVLRVGDEVMLIPWEADDIGVLDLKSGMKAELGYPCSGGYDCGAVIGHTALIFPFDITRDMIYVDVSDRNRKVYAKKTVQLTKDRGRWLHMAHIPSADDECWISVSFGEIWKVDEKGDILFSCPLVLDKEVGKKIIDAGIADGSLCEWHLGSGIVNEGMALTSLESFISVIARG